MYKRQDSWFDNNEFLAIVMDTGDTKRISDKRYTKAKFIIKMQQDKLKSQMFTLKSINVKSRSKMAFFFEQLANQTINAALSVAIEGSVNILDDTISFAADYTTEVVNEVTSQKKFKPIKASKNQFEPFKPKDVNGSKTVQLSFPIKQEYLESEHTICLLYTSELPTNSRV